MNNLILLTLLFTLSFEEEYQQENSILVLNNNNFQQAIQEFPYLFVEFYAQWCPHCKQFKPKYEQIAIELKDTNIKLAKVDVDREKILAAKHKIQKIPSFYFYREGLMQQYDGPKDKKEILEYVKQFNKPAISEIDNEEKLLQFIATNEYSLIYFLQQNDQQNKNLKQIMLNLGSQYKNVNMIFAKDQLRDKFNIKEDFLVLFQNANDSKYIPFKPFKQFTYIKIEIKLFLDQNTKPQQKSESVQNINQSKPNLEEITNVLVITKENFEILVQDSSQDVFLEFYAPWCGHCKQLAPTWEKLGQKVSQVYLNDRVLIAKIDSTVHRIPSIPIKGYPTLQYFKKRNGQMEVIQYKGGRTLNELYKFIEQQQQQEQQTEVKKDDL